jgi:hypothetical protein
VSEPVEGKYFRAYIRAWAVIVVTGAFALGAGLIVIGNIHGLPASLPDILRGVGSSVIASIILYVLVSVLIDPKREVAQAQQAIMYGVQAANRQFAERFEVALPTAVYEGSNLPKPMFRDAFVDLLSSSTRYDFKGDSASFTTYRLARCCDRPEIRRLDQIRLCVLDPLSDRAVSIYAEQYLRQHGQSYDAIKAAEMAIEIKTDIFVSLWTLYSIRHKVTVSVYFHADLPFFRCELFDGGMFLTYYLDRKIYPDYPETLQFSARTRPYRAYSNAVAVARTFAPKMVMFCEMSPGADVINTDDKFLALLNDLGCELPQEELDRRRDKRFQLFDKWLSEVGFDASELF